MSEKTKPKKLDEQTQQAIAEAFQVELLREILAELRAIREQLKTEVVIRDKFR